MCARISSHFSPQKHTGLKVREKEAAWRELLHLLHPLPEGGRTRLVIPEEDDFDPDTYGIVQEKPEPCEDSVAAYRIPS